MVAIKEKIGQKSKLKPNPLFKVRENISKAWYAAGTVIAFTSILVIWTVMSYLELVNPVFLPTPTEVLSAFVSSLGQSSFWGDVGISVYRVFMGFLLACAIGIPLGILAGTFKIAESFVLPTSEFIRYMPAAAFIPLIMVWAGIGETAKILVIFIGCFFQLVLMVTDDTNRINKDLLSASYTLGANRLQVITKVILPALMPKLMTTMRLIMGWAWTYLVVAELVAANSGLGYSIMKAQRFLNTEQIFVGILVIGLLGLIIDRLFAWLNKKLFPWAEGGQ